MALLLKDFQRRTVDQVEAFFEALATEHQKFERIPKEVLREYGEINWPEKAWQTLYTVGNPNHEYKSKKAGNGKHCPHFCIKLPTGGGKTLMATYAIEQYLQAMKQKPTGLVLWVVPSEQIFSQTLKALKDRSHPYREKLDDITGGRIKIITKKDNFSPQEVKQGLVILVMMLQSFSRDQLKKDDLKFFQDDGRFPEFFPSETNMQKQKELYEAFPNLDPPPSFNALLPSPVRTSLGNVVKILEPLVILDEGHKAKSELALSAISECNPSCVIELTATPADGSNVLFSIAGRELEQEGMIKLDLNLVEEEVTDWKRLMDFSAEKLDALQKEADTYRKQSSVYIRPINLIQVEKTGKDQRGADTIHADDVREYLIDSGIPAEQIAIKTSSQNDIEDVDLFSPACAVRFIITKQALQEGWDCSFAYLLTVLSGSKSKTALTQLIGRVLRQPYARKTGNEALDQSYVYCLRDSSRNLIEVIKKGFELDGLGDLFDRVKPSQSSATELGERKKQEIRSPEFEKSLEEFILPIFVTRDSKDQIRELDFAYDILPFIDYAQIDLSSLDKIHFDPTKKSRHTVTAFNFSTTVAVDSEEFLAMKEKEDNALGDTEFRISFFVRNILDLVPNPWIGKQVIDRALTILRKRFKEQQIAENQIIFLDAIRIILGGDNEKIGEINRLAREVFIEKLKKDDIRFVLRFDADAVLERESYYEGQGRESFKMSLFEPTVKGTMNDFEKEFAHFIEEKKDRTYWWYRNKPKNGYHLVGWRKGRFYPDFIFTVQGNKSDTFQKIFVLETKGAHLGLTQDTQYKRELVKEYNEFFDKIKEPWGTTTKYPTPKKVQFELVTQGEWKSEVNKLFTPSTS